MTNYLLGKDFDHPLRCNGVEGELNYLEELVLSNGTPFIFHRLISRYHANRMIDVYELVSSDGKYWDLLFMDMYFTSTTEQVPVGYKFSDHAEELQRFIGGMNRPNDPTFLVERSIGSNGRIRNFPSDLIEKFHERYGNNSKLKSFFQFERPEAHLKRLEALNIRI